MHEVMVDRYRAARWEEYMSVSTYAPFIVVNLYIGFYMEMNISNAGQSMTCDVMRIIFKYNPRIVKD